MFLTYLMLAVALCLSAVAAFYSIVGLTAIFAASIIPVVIMGSILEVAKLVITVWLHEYWSQVKWAMRMYLIPSVAVLMFITSMGIFGFLSKAHIEQVGVGQENAAQLQRIDAELKRQTDVVEKAEARARTLETSGTGADANVNSQIRTEQDRIDAALARVQPAIDEQNKIVDAQTRIYQDQINKIDQQSSQLQKFIDAKEIDKAQALVGTAVDGNWGPGTAAAVRTWQGARARERSEAVAKLEQANDNPTIRAAREEIARVRRTVETQVAESNRLIDRLRNQLGKGDTASVETLVNEQQDRIRAATAEIETLTRKKYDLQAEYRKLAVEVGPIKYIAELIYGESTDTNLLEKAVRWVIILIVAVFDPLAVMMLLAATESMSWIRQRSPRNKDKLNYAVASADTASAVSWTKFYSPSISPTVNPQPITDTAEKKTNESLDDDDDPNEPASVKDAKKNWKADHPGHTLKEQKRLLASGAIDKLPWEEYLVPLVEADNDVRFGNQWPENASKGAMFLNTTYYPSKLFKYNGFKWIEVDKNLSDNYVYNDAYINYLMDKISTGEYDVDMLSDAERIQIETRLK
jgi:hypothetical protein